MNIFDLFKKKQSQPKTNPVQNSPAKPTCPYCSIELEQFPQRKTKCKNCGNYYFVRRDPADKIRKIVTQDQVEAFDRQWAQLAKQQEQNKFQDLQKKAMELMQQSPVDWHQLSGIYREIAHIQNLRSIPFQQALEKSYWCMLQNYLSPYGPKKVEILSADDACPECKSQNGKTFTIQEAIETMPLPTKTCCASDHWCRCTYLPIIK